jgi:hypothetical protein
MKTINKITMSLLLLALIVSCTIDAETQKGQKMKNSKYAAGQVWKYKTRSGEENSLLYIVRIDKHDDLGQIYHIAVDNLSIKNPRVETGISNYLPHAPVSVVTLDSSVISLVEARADNLPDISEGYQTWREAFDKGSGGVFTIPVAEIIQLCENAMSGKTDDR